MICFEKSMIRQSLGHTSRLEAPGANPAPGRSPARPLRPRSLSRSLRGERSTPGLSEGPVGVGFHAAQNTKKTMLKGG